jgi:hypothetical protein
MVVKLRIGYGLDRVFPPASDGTGPMMIVIGWMPAFARLGIEQGRADEQHRAENSQDDRRPHARCLEFRQRWKRSLQLKGPSRELDGPLLAHSHEPNPYMNFMNLSFASSIT